MLDSFKRVEDGQKRLLSHCNRCGQTSIHRVEVEFRGRWDDGNGYFGGEEYKILRCGGCDGVKYSESSWDNQSYYEDENGETEFERTTRYFPAQQIRKLDADFLFNVPNKIYHVLTETLAAQSNSNLVLATVGLRILIETICNAAACKEKTLIKKINELETLGLINKDEKDLFQQVRDFGNKGAHLGEAMSAEQVASGLDISIHLLDTLFIAPAKKTKLLKKAKSTLTKK